MTYQAAKVAKLSTARVALEELCILMMKNNGMSGKTTTATEQLSTGLTFEESFQVNRIYVAAQAISSPMIFLPTIIALKRTDPQVNLLHMKDQFATSFESLIAVITPKGGPAE